MKGTKQTRRFRLGMAGYTYARLSVDKTLASMKQADVHYLCVKDYHLPLNAKPAEIAAFRRKCADHGVTPHGVGVIYIGSEDEAKRSFDYAAELGVPVVVGAPWKPAADGSTDMRRRRQSPFGEASTSIPHSRKSIGSSAFTRAMIVSRDLSSTEVARMRSLMRVRTLF